MVAEINIDQLIGIADGINFHSNFFPCRLRGRVDRVDRVVHFLFFGRGADGAET